MINKLKRNPDVVLAIAAAIVLPIIFEGDSKIWVAVSFGVFIVAFGRKIWVAIVGKLDERATNIQKEIEDAQHLREEAQSLLADYEAKRIEAEAEAEKIIEQAHNEALRESARAKEDLENMLKRRSELAAQRIKHAEEEALAAVRQEAATLAVNAAAIIINEGLTESQSENLVTNSIKSIRERLH
ncbi:MAG: F0F1 ATP synthase subunit B [Rhodospirillaceae bacterium]|nr:F0F1 ATP synthase subunit B [Rhodospirillaceae bacterium]|tara:strand:- start:2417 stop:2971 length:555 start_codon:yes stop_codon:yes gene_type:complete